MKRRSETRRQYRARMRRERGPGWWKARDTGGVTGSDFAAWGSGHVKFEAPNGIDTFDAAGGAGGWGIVYTTPTRGFQVAEVDSTREAIEAYNVWRAEVTGVA